MESNYIKEYGRNVLGCQPSLDPSVISQVEIWKNVPKEVKSKFMKGFSAQNIVSYALVDNLGGTLRFVGDNLEGALNSFGNIFN